MLLAAFSSQAQTHSLQFSAGVVYPRSSSNGYSVSFQYQRQITDKLSLYFYSGYTAWDQFYIIYIEDLTPPQERQFFPTYSSDDNKIIPVYVGLKYNFHTNKYFSSFLNIEAGYSYFNYNSYENVKIIDNATGKTLRYEIDPTTKRNVTDNLYGLGIGGGISYPFTSNVRAILEYKLNSNFNSGKFGLFSAKGTYSTVSLGVNYSFED